MSSKITPNKLNWQEIYERIKSVYSANTQNELGVALGVSQDLVSNWKTGKAIPTWQLMEKVVAEKGVTWQWLLTGKNTELREGGTLFQRLKRRLALRFNNNAITNKEMAKRLGVTTASVNQWEKGESRPEYEVLVKAEELTGSSVDYFVTGYLYDIYGEALTKEAYGLMPLYDEKKALGLPESNAARPGGPANIIMAEKGIPVVGEAAADETEGSRAGFFPQDPEAYFDEISLPKTTVAVKILGDSMSPVLLDGQYALVGLEYDGAYRPRDYDIVVAEVQVHDDEVGRSDRRWEGVYCKRIVDAETTWMFLSINESGKPFTVAKANCRLWPVIGVWFGGKGKAPVGE